MMHHDVKPTVQMVAVDAIRHRADARQRTDEALTALADSIENVGLINPIRGDEPAGVDRRHGRDMAAARGGQADALFRGRSRPRAEAGRSVRCRWRSCRLRGHGQRQQDRRAHLSYPMVALVRSHADR